MDEDSKLSLKDIPIYHWPTKEEGKEQYSKFSKEFLATLKNLRFILEPGGIERFLGNNPGRRPAAQADRQEWLTRTMHYEGKVDKLEMHCATALGALEKSFPYGTTPRNIIDKAAEVPPDVLAADWTYRRRFLSCWEALTKEYKPTSSVDLRLLRDQIHKLTDDGPGGFETFRSEFHRLHTEIMATGVADAITARELNEIVRDGIKNQFIWVSICYNIYKNDSNAPWQNTFEAISTALTSYRQKGFDPYAEARSGPSTTTTISVSANSASTAHVETKFRHENKRAYPFNQDNSGRSQRHQKNHMSAQGNPSDAEDPSNTPDLVPKRCTRCWNADSHSFKDCQEIKCCCGSTLSLGQVVCFNYDNHPENMRFIRKMPKFIATALQAYRKSKSNQTGNHFQSRAPKRPQDKRKLTAMLASTTEEAADNVAATELDSWN